MKKARHWFPFFNLHKRVTVHLRGTLSEECFLEDWASIERELAAKEAEPFFPKFFAVFGEEMVG